MLMRSSLGADTKVEKKGLQKVSSTAQKLIMKPTYDGRIWIETAMLLSGTTYHNNNNTIVLLLLLTI